MELKILGQTAAELAEKTPSEWFMWPFSRGYGESFWPTAAKFIFVAFIFAAICVFLRFLYGPNGKFRDKELDKEYEELRQQELQKLEAEYLRGEITKEQYEWRKERT